MTPHRRGKPDLVEVGMFMFFAWPILLMIGIFQVFFSIVGWLFEQWWFYILGPTALIAFVILGLR